MKGQLPGTSNQYDINGNTDKLSRFLMLSLPDFVFSFLALGYCLYVYFVEDYALLE